MRTTLNIDDELVRKAQEFTGIKSKTALLEEGLRQLIQREVAKRLIALRGASPNAKAPPRRRPPHFRNS